MLITQHADMTVHPVFRLCNTEIIINKIIKGIRRSNGSYPAAILRTRGDANSGFPNNRCIECPISLSRKVTEIIMIPSLISPTNNWLFKLQTIYIYIYKRYIYIYKNDIYIRVNDIYIYMRM